MCVFCFGVGKTCDEFIWVSFNQQNLISIKLVFAVHFAIEFCSICSRKQTQRVNSCVWTQIARVSLDLQRFWTFPFLWLILIFNFHLTVIFDFSYFERKNVDMFSVCTSYCAAACSSSHERNPFSVPPHVFFRIIFLIWKTEDFCCSNTRYLTATSKKWATLITKSHLVNLFYESLFLVFPPCLCSTPSVIIWFIVDSSKQTSLHSLTGLRTLGLTSRRADIDEKNTQKSETDEITNSPPIILSTIAIIKSQSSSYFIRFFVVF